MRRGLSTAAGAGARSRSKTPVKRVRRRNGVSSDGASARDELSIAPHTTERQRHDDPHTPILSTPYSNATTPASAMHPLHEWDAISSIVKVASYRGASREQQFESLLRHGKSAVLTTSKPSMRRSALGFLESLFLPVGYPHSVTPDYLQFQCWDTIQAMCSYLRGALCTHAVLSGLGVGEAGASATSAVLSWILRDGVGMLGGLLFTYLGAKSFNSNLKGWRLFADCINDVGLTMELVSPLLPKVYFLPLLSAGCICRSMCGVSAGATRAALMQHFALSGNNIADLSAKESSQETIVTLGGMLFGALVVQAIEGEKRVQYTWLLFILLTVVHVYANFRGVTGLILRSLNVQRTHLVINYFLHSDASSSSSPSNSLPVLSPSELALHERLLWTDASGIELGACFHQTITSLSKLDEMLAINRGEEGEGQEEAVKSSERLTSNSADDGDAERSTSSDAFSHGYLLVPSPAGRSIRILLSSSITPKQQVRAIFHALSFRRRLRLAHKLPRWESDPWWSTRMLRKLATVVDVHSWGRKDPFRSRRPLPIETRTAAHEASVETSLLFERFHGALKKAGWDTEHVILNAGEWRCDGEAMRERAENMPQDLYQF